LFVETVRLLIVLFSTVAGFELADGGTGDAAFTGALVGACTGYVIGGVFGRWLQRSIDGLERRQHGRSIGEVITAGAMAALFGLIGALVAATFLVLFPYRWVYPLAALCAWTMTVFGARLGLSRSGEILVLWGLAPRPLADARNLGEEFIAGAMLVDTSAILDGRLLHVARAGFIGGQLLVPRFVVDELQSIADAEDPLRRRQGRQGLEMLEALGDERRVVLRILDEEISEVDTIGAKLVVLGQRLGVGLVTMDRSLAKSAELQGVHCLNLQRLAEGLQETHSAGDVVRVELVKEGTEPGQAVGFLADGSMLVVGDAVEHIGSWIGARISSEVQTAKGRIFFASFDAENGDDGVEGLDAEEHAPSQ
jgi:uncharacterized protein YacL